MRRIRTSPALAGLAILGSLVLSSCWLAPDSDPSRSGFNAGESTLNQQTIGALALHWNAHLGQQPTLPPGVSRPIPMVSQPITDGSSVYVATGNPSNAVVAIEAATGTVRWTSPIANPGAIGMVRPTIDNGQIVIVQPSTAGVARVERFETSTGSLLGSESIPAPGGSSVEVAADNGHEVVTVFGADGVELRYGTVGSDATAPVFTHEALLTGTPSGQTPAVRSAATVVGPRAYVIAPTPSQLFPDFTSAFAIGLDDSCSSAAPCAPLWSAFGSQGPAAIASRIVAVDANTVAVVSADVEFSPGSGDGFDTVLDVRDSATGHAKQGSTFLQGGANVRYTQPATDGVSLYLPRFGRLEVYDAFDCVQGRGECFPTTTLQDDPLTGLGQTVVTSDLVFAAGNEFVDVFPRTCPVNSTCAPLRRLSISDGTQSISVSEGRLYVATIDNLVAFDLPS